MNFIYSDPFIKRLIYILLPLFDQLKTFFYRKRIIIHGSYYTSNIGDRAISIVLKSELKKHGYKSIIVSHFFHQSNNRNFIIGGGGVIHNLYEHNLEYRTRIVKSTSNVQYIGVGTPGFSILSDQDMNNLKLLSNATYISVRDKYTHDLLLSLANIHSEVLACPAWLIYRHLNYNDVSIRNIIFRSYYNLFFFDKLSSTCKKKIGLIINGHFDLEHLIKIKTFIRSEAKDHDVVFIPFVGEDIEFYQKELKDLNISHVKLKGPIETYKYMLSMDKIIATRYHSVIFSILMNKPLLILAYSQKVISLAEDLNLNFYDLYNSKEGHLSYNISFNKELIDKKILEAEMQISKIISNIN